MRLRTSWSSSGGIGRSCLDGGAGRATTGLDGPGGRLDGHFDLGPFQEAPHFGQGGLLPGLEFLDQAGVVPGLDAELELDEAEGAETDEGEAPEAAGEEIGDLQGDVGFVADAEIADEDDDDAERGAGAGGEAQAVVGEAGVHGSGFLSVEGFWGQAGRILNCAVTAATPAKAASRTRAEPVRRR